HVVKSKSSCQQAAAQRGQHFLLDAFQVDGVVHEVQYADASQHADDDGCLRRRVDVGPDFTLGDADAYLFFQKLQGGAIQLLYVVQQRTTADAGFHDDGGHGLGACVQSLSACQIEGRHAQDRFQSCLGLGAAKQVFSRKIVSNIGGQRLQEAFLVAEVVGR